MLLSDGAVLTYIALLFISAVLLSVVAIRGFGQSTGTRVLDGIIAVGFLGYAIYLLFFAESDEIRIFFYAILAPVFAIVQIVKGSKAKREQAAAAAGQAGWEQPVPGAPYSGHAPQTAAPNYQHPLGNGNSNGPVAGPPATPGQPPSSR